LTDSTAWTRRARAAARAGTEATPGSSGLGLSIAQQIARAHRGQISLRSSGVPGEGCMFEVRLSLATEAFL
jgi:signal transduction histidine kinase